MAWAMTFGKGSSKDLREGNCRPTTHGFVGCAVNIVDNPDQATGLHHIQPQEHVHKRVDKPLGPFA